MANPQRGSVALQAGDRAYTLSLSVNAMCELEDAIGQPISQIAEQLNRAESVRLSTVRALVWAALRDHHPETTLAQAGELMSAVGVPAVMEKIGEAFQLAFPDGGEGAPAGGKNPRRAKAG